MKVFRLIGYAVLLFVSISPGKAQSTLRFSAASVKPDPETGPYPPLRVGPESFSAGEPLLFLLRYAYQVTEVSGIPDWASSKIFDIQARSERPVSPDQMRGMLKSLLGERFGVKAHMERKSLRGYALVVKRKPQLKPHVSVDHGAKPPAIMVSPKAVLGDGASMKQLATVLSLKLHLPVDDETGLTGIYDFRILFNPALQASVGNPSIEALNSAEAAGGVDSLPSGLSDLGLELTSRKIDRDVLVVEAARMPSPN